MLKVWVCELQPFLMVPKSSASGATVRHTGPIAAESGTAIVGLVGFDTEACRIPESVTVPLGTCPVGETRTTTGIDLPGCSSCVAIALPGSENAGARPA